MKSYAKVWPPHVNQIELHPWCQQRRIDEYCQKNGIVVEAYSPLVRNYKEHDETLVGVSKKYGVTTAQVLIRYSLQKNWVPLPKSDTPSRIVANADVYGFEIGKEEMKTLDDLDQGEAGAIVQAVTNS
jgi:diketogulonate reductase-like aldo/keto reductase